MLEQVPRSRLGKLVQVTSPAPNIEHFVSCWGLASSVEDEDGVFFPPRLGVTNIFCHFATPTALSTMNTFSTGGSDIEVDQVIN